MCDACLNKPRRVGLSTTSKSIRLFSFMRQIVADGGFFSKKGKDFDIRHAGAMIRSGLDRFMGLIWYLLKCYI